MIRVKEIKLEPSEWYLDYYIVDEPYAGNFCSKESRQKLSSFFEKRYGADREYYFEQFHEINTVLTISSTKESEMSGETRIVMIINPDVKTLVHELVHVLHHFSNNSGIELSYDSQEWQAILTENLFTQCSDFDNISEMK